MSHSQISQIINGQTRMIDEALVDIILFCNEIGLTTEHCCQGEDELLSQPNIIFTSTVNVDNICNLIKNCLNKYQNSALVGKFSMWFRIINFQPHINWMYTAPTLKACIQDWKHLMECYYAQQI